MTSELKGSNSQTLSLEVSKILKDNLHTAYKDYCGTTAKAASKNGRDADVLELGEWITTLTGVELVAALVGDTSLLYE